MYKCTVHSWPRHRPRIPTKAACMGRHNRLYTNVESPSFAKTRTSRVHRGGGHRPPGIGSAPTTFMCLRLKPSSSHPSSVRCRQTGRGMLMYRKLSASSPRPSTRVRHRVHWSAEIGFGSGAVHPRARGERPAGPARTRRLTIANSQQSSNQHSSPSQGMWVHMGMWGGVRWT